MAEFFQLHQLIHFHGFRLANAINIVASQINEHDMLCPIFGGGEKLLAQTVVLCNVS